MARAFSFQLHKADAGIVTVHSRGGQRVTPELLAQVQAEMAEFAAWIRRTFAERPFRLMTVLENMSLALDNESEMAAQGTLALAQAFNVARAAYVTDRATLRMQFSRLFRENNLSSNFRAFATESEGLAFLRSDSHSTPTT